MRGAGLGGLFARLFRSSVPYLKTLGRYAKNQILDAGAGILTDIKSGVNVRDAVKKNAMSTRDRIVTDIKRKMTGRGVKRRKNRKKKMSKRKKKTLDNRKNNTRGKRVKNRKKNRKKRDNDIFF